MMVVDVNAVFENMKAGWSTNIINVHYPYKTLGGILGEHKVNLMVDGSFFIDNGSVLDSRRLTSAQEKRIAERANPIVKLL